MTGANRPRRIMFLAPHMRQGGAVRVLSEISCNMDTSIEQTIVLFEPDVSYPHKARLVSLDCVAHGESVVSRTAALCRRFWRFRRTLQQETPDCVVSFLGEANAINALLSEIPILTSHISLAEEHRRLTGLIFKKLVPFLYPRGRVVAVSDGCRRELLSEYGLQSDRVTTIHNPIYSESIDRLSSAPLEEPLRSVRCPIVVSAGRLVEQKGFAYLIRSFAELRKTMESELWLLGEGPLKGELMCLTESLGISRHVRFLGWRQNPFSLFRTATVFALTSEYEGFGNVLVEAMACETPVVSTDCPFGPREILAPHSSDRASFTEAEYAKFGVLVPNCAGGEKDAKTPLSDSETVLVATLRKVISDSEFRGSIRRPARGRALEFSSQRVAQRYADLIEEELGRE